MSRRSHIASWPKTNAGQLLGHLPEAGGNRRVTCLDGELGQRGVSARLVERIWAIVGARRGLRLFLANGYENTTLDTIAAEAGISRRTFFAYFKSKEDILFVWQSGAWSAILADLLTVSPDEHPLDAACHVATAYLARYTNEQMRTIDRLMRSSESLHARKQVFYEEQEQALFATLCEVWRQPQRRPVLRMVAMMCVGVVRLSVETWSQQETTNLSIADVLQESFTNLRLGIQ